MSMTATVRPRPLASRSRASLIASSSGTGGASMVSVFLILSPRAQDDIRLALGGAGVRMAADGASKCRLVRPLPPALVRADLLSPRCTCLHSETVFTERCRLATLVGSYWFGLGLFLSQLAEASWNRKAPVLAHAAVTALAFVMQLLFSFRFLMGLSKFLTSVLLVSALVIQARVTVILDGAFSDCHRSLQKDERDIPIIFVIGTFFFDFYGEQSDSFVGRMLAANCILSCLAGLLMVWLLALNIPRPQVSVV